MRLSMDRGRPLPDPIACLIRALRPFSPRPGAMGHSARTPRLEMTHDLNGGERGPIDSRGDHDQDYPVYGHCRGDRHNKPREVQCPRVTLAAMIAAAAFGPRRSGKLRER